MENAEVGEAKLEALEVVSSIVDDIVSSAVNGITKNSIIIIYFLLVSPFVHYMAVFAASFTYFTFRNCKNVFLCFSPLLLVHQ